MQKSYFFKEKIECLYKSVAKESLSTLALLFANGTDAKHRRIHIQNKWLRKSEREYKPRAFKKEYTSYPFYRTVLLDNEPIFKDGAEFLEISLEEFCSRVHQYMNTLNLDTLGITKEQLPFTYLLAYNQESKNSYHIMEWQIIYSSSSIESNSYPIEVHRIEKGKETSYKGKLSIKNQKLHLEFFNDTDHITAIFNIELLNSKTEYIIGVAIGISDINQKVPVAKKVILSKAKPKPHEYKDYYLTLNETEAIYAEENTYAFEIEQTELLQKHFVKYTQKIDRLDNFIKLFTQEYTKTVAHRVGSLQLHGLKRFFERLRNNREFYIFTFYQGFKSIFLTLRQRYIQKLYMVLPIFSDEFIFNHFSKNARETLAMIESAVSNGITIEIIFITDSCNRDFGLEFGHYLKSLAKVSNIYFIHKDDLQKESSSNEFIYTEKRDFIFYKPLRSTKRIYKFSTDNEFIEYLDSYFWHLYYKATPYAEIEKNGQLCIEKFKYSIDGLYLYIVDDKKILELQFQQYDKSNINILHNGNHYANGQFIRQQEQTIVLFENISTYTSTTIMFDNFKLLRDAFLGYVTKRSPAKDLTTFNIAICSRKPISKEEIEKILKEKQMQPKTKEIEKRPNEYFSQ